MAVCRLSAGLGHDLLRPGQRQVTTFFQSTRSRGSWTARTIPWYLMEDRMILDGVTAVISVIVCFAPPWFSKDSLCFAPFFKQGERLDVSGV